MLIGITGYAGSGKEVDEEQFIPAPAPWLGYEVGDRGSVVSLKSGRPRRLSWVKTRGGYPSVNLRTVDGKRCFVNVHRLVMLAFEGPACGLHVRHLDNNKMNASLANLTYGTVAENIADSVTHGLVPSGDRHYACRISGSDIDAMRRRAAAGELYRDIARSFGISKRYVGQLVRGERRAVKC